MRTIIVTTGIFFAILSGVVLENRAQAQTYVNIDLFYEELSPYGGWAPHEEFGDVWQPYEVGPDWKPYTDGRWAWSDQGWIWISYEPWGWATYHYGRWVFDDYQGWIWIPGTTWAPAWVSWHQSPEYIGWSPLPPDRGFFIEIGFVFNSYNSYYYKPYHYKHRHKKYRYYYDYYYNHHNYRPPARHCVFLPTHSFGHHKHAGKAAIPDPQDAIVFRDSKNITNIQHSGNKVINYGPDKYYIEKRSNRKLVKHNIVNKDNVVLRGNKNVNAVKGNTYNVYRPKIERNPFVKTRSSREFESPDRAKDDKSGNPVYHNYGQFNKTGVNTNLQKNHDIPKSNPGVSTKPGNSNKIGNRGSSNIANENVYKHNQQKNINKQVYKTSPSSNGKNNFNKRLIQQNKLRTKNTQGPKVKNEGKNPNNRYNAVNKNTQSVKSNNKTTDGYKNRSANKSNQNTNKSNYSRNKKSASSAKNNVSQTRSYNTTIKMPPSSNARSFSKR